MSDIESCLEYRLDGWPGRRVPARHERGAVPGSLLPSRHSRSYEEDTPALRVLGPPDSVLVLRVPAVYDDVALGQKRNELLNEGVNSSPSLDQDHHSSWLLQFSHHLLQAMSSNYICSWCLRTQY